MNRLLHQAIVIVYRLLDVKLLLLLLLLMLRVDEDASILLLATYSVLAGLLANV